MATKTDPIEEPTQAEPEGFDPLDWDAEGWRPEPGAKVWGFVVKTETADGDFGPYPLVELFTGNAEQPLVNLHCFHSVLRSSVENLHPQFGDRMGVKYKGKKMTGSKGQPVGFNGNGYEDYNVVVIPKDRLDDAERKALAAMQSAVGALPAATEA